MGVVGPLTVAAGSAFVPSPGDNGLPITATLVLDVVTLTATGKAPLSSQRVRHQQRAPRGWMSTGLLALRAILTVIQVPERISSTAVLGKAITELASSTILALRIW